MLNTYEATHEQFVTDFGFTESEVTEVKHLEEMPERGEWPEGPTVHIGRPRELGEDSQMATFRLSAAKARAVDQKATRQGKNRSGAPREAVGELLERA